MLKVLSILCDAVEYSKMTESIIERMISFTKPEINDSAVDLGSISIMYNNEKYKVVISEDSYKRYADGPDIKVYFIDFEAVEQKESIFNAY